MGTVLAKPLFGIGRPIPASRNSQLAGYFRAVIPWACQGGMFEPPSEATDLCVEYPMGDSKLPASLSLSLFLSLH